ncbi:MAG: macro domain-containing protein [Eggerthellaceae bacterium]|nr:macro domain-containing protein [Eggerthellaceae bacterium]
MAGLFHDRRCKAFLRTLGICGRGSIDPAGHADEGQHPERSQNGFCESLGLHGVHLPLADVENLSSIAFRCISTGVFGFPQQEATEIAVKTVRKWLDRNSPEMTVVFNVFGEKDELESMGTGVLAHQALLGSRVTQKLTVNQYPRPH